MHKNKNSKLMIFLANYEIGISQEVRDFCTILLSSAEWDISTRVLFLFACPVSLPGGFPGKVMRGSLGSALCCLIWRDFTCKD